MSWFAGQHHYTRYQSLSVAISCFAWLCSALLCALRRDTAQALQNSSPGHRRLARSLRIARPISHFAELNGHDGTCFQQALQNILKMRPMPFLYRTCKHTLINTLSIHHAAFLDHKAISIFDDGNRVECSGAFKQSFNMWQPKAPCNNFCVIIM